MMRSLALVRRRWAASYVLSASRSRLYCFPALSTTVTVAQFTVIRIAEEHKANVNGP
jgi:hypothetical protein